MVVRSCALTRKVVDLKKKDCIIQKKKKDEKIRMVAVVFWYPSFE